MLIYILHSDKFYRFRLPKNVFGSYVLQDYDSSGLKRNLVNVNSVNSKWVIYSNENIKIMMNGKFISSVELQYYNFYTLVMSSNERLFLYVSPGYENTYEVRKYVSTDSLFIGRDSSCDIVFTSQNISTKQLEMAYSKGKWGIKNLNPSVPLYVNSKRVENMILDDFDSVFIMGLKILVCDDLIFINNPLGSVYIMSTNLAQNNNEVLVPDYNTSSQSFIDFYDSSDYFAKSPVFMKTFKTLNLTLTSPEGKNKRSGDSSFIMSLVPSALMSSTSLLSVYFSIKNYREKRTDSETLITTLVMCGIMLFVSLVWPFFERFVENIKIFINERIRIKVYKKYLNQKKDILERARDEQKMSLKFNNLSLTECQDTILKRNANLFSLTAEQERFLTVKLGTGQVPLDCNIDYTRPDFIKSKDKLLDMIDKMINDYRYIDDAPYSFSLRQSIAFINSTGLYDYYMNSIILQLITFQDYYNLKIVVFTSDNSKLASIRNLNHCWDNDRTIRFFATDIQEAETLSSYLVRVFNSRSMSENVGNQFVSRIPFYLIISDDINRYRNLKIINKVLHQKENFGFSLITFSLKITDVPDGCSYFVDFSNQMATLFRSEMQENNIMMFKPELVDSRVKFEHCVRNVSNIPIRINDENSGVLPEKLGFLELYNVGNVQQLNCVSRWKNSQVINTLSAPIAIDINGNILGLDLHERKHGPHGLIAGMTGSGKSEFIITYILSLAVNYSPEEVQFVLIDYKGGGLAGAFENRKTGIKLPHLVGTITNLDISSMNRTLVSIKSELQRRQRKFNEAKELLNTGTIDIYKYQKLVRDGSLTEYMSHLFIICDEFAELKAQQPDFMDELVSAARIGRSLGVHLILATQKPSGVVDEQIWSNAKFKVCCKVQTAEDSKEMIRRDDAAFIKESGRFYLQVGYDEVFIKGQSAYTGTQYIPSETINLVNKGKDSISFLDNLGNVIKTAKMKETEISKNVDLGDELGNVLNYLIQCSKEIGFRNRQLWLDNIPQQLYLYDLLKKYPVQNKKFIINPLIGEYDDPQNQRQGPVFINLTENGNLWVSGSYGGGKTTLLSTIIYSSIVNYNTEELNIYIVDLLAETLKMFLKAPQVGDFISVTEGDKLTKLFHYLNKEVAKRKKHFSDVGGNFSSEAVKGKVPFPNILVVINGLDVMVEQYDELYTEIFAPLIRDCNRVGITFVASSVGSLNVAVENSFPQKIALRYLDNTEYTMVFNDTRGIIPSSTPGRGLVELDFVYEFQVALIFNEFNFEYNLIYVINQLIKYLKKAPTIPVMPRIVTYESIQKDILSLDMLPIGIEVSSNCVCNYDFTKLINLIVFSSVKMVISFEIALMRTLCDLKNVKVITLDVLGIGNTMDGVDGVQLYSSNFKKLVNALYKNILEKKSTDPGSEKIIFIISGYYKLQSHLNSMKAEDSNVKTIDDLIMASVNSENFKFILVNDNTLSSIDEQLWSDYLDTGNGIILGTEIDNQTLIDVDDSYVDIKVNKDVAIVVNNNSKNFIKYIRNRS